jgi:hypothetical protein
MPLAGQQLLPRQVAAHNYAAGWRDHDRQVAMTAIVFAESAGYTEAVGGPNKDGSYDLGLYQLSSNHAEAWGQSPEAFRAMAFDPERARVFAYRLYKNANYTFRPWAAYANGSWEKFRRKALVGVANSYAERNGWTPVPFVVYSK